MRDRNGLTVSIASPDVAAFSFSLVRSRALALAVVERTAVATFSIGFSTMGLFAEGYANKLGLASETKVNAGVSKVRVRLFWRYLLD
jgi:hypothetical protein